jgi:hypothetical protein
MRFALFNRFILPFLGGEIKVQKQLASKGGFFAWQIKA